MQQQGGVQRPVLRHGRSARFLAAIGPRNVALAAEIADGWLPVFFSPDRFGDVHASALEEGFTKRGGRPPDWDLAPLKARLAKYESGSAWTGDLLAP